MEEYNPPNAEQVIREPFLIRNPWFSIVLVMVFYFLFPFILVLIYSLIVQLAFPSFVNKPLFQYIGRIVEFVGLALFLWVFVPYVLRLPSNNQNYNRYTKDIKLTNFKMGPILLSLLITGFMFGFVILGSYIATEISSGIVYFDWAQLTNPDAQLNLYYALSPGIMEEVAFRGIILVLLLRKYRWKVAVIVDGILFGFYHLLNMLIIYLDYLGGDMGDNVFYSRLISTGFQVVFATAIGITWAYLFVKSGSILPCILSHYLIDAIIGVLFVTGNFWWIKILATIGMGIIPSILGIIIMKRVYRNSEQEMIPL